MIQSTTLLRVVHIIPSDHEVATSSHNYLDRPTDAVVSCRFQISRCWGSLSVVYCSVVTS